MPLPPGTWLRSFHSAGPSAGRLVNHLAYALYLPATPAQTAGMPVVVMLHGCKQTAESFAAGTRICRLAERSGFAVLFPEQAKTAHAHRCWHWHGDATQSEAASVASLVDAIVQRQSIKATLLGEDIARVALFLAADDSRMVTKQSITVDAGLR